MSLFLKFIDGGGNNDNHNKLFFMSKIMRDLFKVWDILCDNGEVLHSI